MIRSLITKTMGVAAMAAVFTLASCKGDDAEERNDNDVEIIGDSIAPTGSDGLGREIDTVEQIERSLQDTVITRP